MLGVDRHAHGQVTSSPRGLRIEVDHSPHVVVDIVHLDSVGDLLLIELGSTTENVDVLVAKDATCSTVSSHVEISDSGPGIILDVILLTSSVERLGIVSTDNKDQAPFTIKSSEVRSPEK